MPVYQRCPECSRLTRLHELDGRVTTKKCANSKCRLTLPPFGRILVLWYRDGSGKRHVETLGRVGLQIANAELSKRKADIAEGRYGTRAWTWGEVCTAYLRHLEAQESSERHQASARRYLAAFTDKWGSDLPISQITPQMIQDIRDAEQQDRHLSKRTADYYLQVGGAAWRYSLPDIPCPWAKVKQYRPDNRVTEWLTDEERLGLLLACWERSTSFYEIVVFCLLTGLRKMQVARLRRDQVDFVQGLLTFKQKGGRIEVRKLSQGAVRVLVGIPNNGTQWFWIGPKGSPVSTCWLWRNFEKAKNIAGIDRPFRFHGLRHDAATLITRFSGNLRVTQDFLGHSQITTTERYAHLLPSLLDTANQQLDNLVAVPMTVPQENPK